MDVPKVAKSLPGVDSVSKIDDTTYEGALTVRVGPIKLNLQGKIILEEQNKTAWRAALRAEAKDRMAAGAVNGKTSMTLKEIGANQTELVVETDVNIFGQDRRVWSTDHPQESRRDAQRIRREHQETTNWKVTSKNLRRRFRFLLLLSSLAASRFGRGLCCSSPRPVFFGPPNCPDNGNIRF